MKDVLFLTISSFGGPQAHMAMFLDIMVLRRKYLTEEELIELNALCQILPGPTSTQTITAIGFRVGGPGLAYLTLMVWVLPAFIIMTVAALLISHFQAKNLAEEYTRFILPIAIGLVAVAAFRISKKIIISYEGIGLLVIAASLSYLIRTPFIYPVLLLGGGFLTAFKFKEHPVKSKEKFRVEWSNFILWAVVLILAAIAGAITKFMPIRIFENFYRNGSLVFGGGQVLIPLLYTEFVNFKKQITSEEFLSGFAIVQAIPGPTFSISAYIGALIMNGKGLGWQMVGAFTAAAGIFLPGVFLIFFVIKFWEKLKKYRIVRASLEGIQAASAGMVIAAVFLLMEPIQLTILNVILMTGTFILLIYTRVPAPVLILIGLVLGIVL